MNPDNMIETINGGLTTTSLTLGEEEGAVGGSFLGVTIDTINGPTNPKIKKVLDQGFHLLNILDFIQVTKFKLNMTMFDYFWQVVVGNTRSHVTTRVLEWFGYGEDFRIQRQNFKKMLKRNDISYRELTQRDPEIDQYPTIQEELQLIPSNVTNSKFLIMEPDDLKMAIMQLKTKNGHKIRQYYIDLEKLLKMYVEYTLYFNHREASRKITNLEQMMARMDLEREQDRQRMERQEQEREQDRETNRRLEESNKRQEEYMRSMGIQLEDVRDQNEELLGETKGLKKQNKKIAKVGYSSRRSRTAPGGQR